MKADENKLLRFLEGHDKKFIIPVYQRNYDWKKEQCKQLFDDILDVIRNKRNTHFFGSIVYIYDDDGDGQELIIIDGQQRITTVSLLILAITNVCKIKNDSSVDTNMILNEYLLGKYTQKEKIKLKPVKNDKEAFLKLFETQEKEFLPSNITNNYIYFKDRLYSENINLNEFFNALKKLDVVDIKLKKGEDDPQLIFESLNSTGLDLNEADKVRNFILMSQKHNQQELFYEKYWNKIELLTKYEVSNFLRDYLTLKEKKAPNKDKVYIAFKDYFNKNYNRDNLELLLSELLVYAGYYNKIVYNNHEDKKINELFTYLNKLEVTVSYPFLLEILNDIEKEKILKIEDVQEILSVIESYIFRRVICDVQTNSLNKIFMTLGKDIKKFDDYKEHYLDILKYLLLQKKGSQRFPDDIEISEKLIIKDIYNMNSKNKIHLLERIENYNNREKVSIQDLLENGDLSIEHIMPRTLNNSWKKSLGENFQEIHDKYLHTIGNITLTAYNSEMSNKSFIEKKQMNGGFDQSKLILNEYLKKANEWNEKEILNRANILKTKFLEIWKHFKSDYINKRDVENTYTLDDDYSFTGEKIKHFEFLDQEIKVDSWVEFLHHLSLSLFDFEKTKFEMFSTDYDFRKRSILISNNEDDIRKPLKIAENLYIEGNLSSESILNLSRMMLKKLNIEGTEVSICLREKE